MATSFEYSRQAQTYDTTRAASPSVLGPLRAALAPATVGVATAAADIKDLAAVDDHRHDIGVAQHPVEGERGDWTSAVAVVDPELQVVAVVDRFPASGAGVDVQDDRRPACSRRTRDLWRCVWRDRLGRGPTGGPTLAMRRALSVRDGGCMFPGCGVDMSRCDAHHVIPWEWDGPTDLANRVMLCRHHHHCVHEGGFVLTRGLDQLVRVWRPDGTALPLGRPGAHLADDEPRPAPHLQTTGEPPDVNRQRQALRHPPPPPPEPTRFLEPVEHRRRRYLTDARNVDRQPPELVTLTWATLDIQRGTVQFPGRSVSSRNR